MQFTFLDMAGKTLFIRDDAERAQWTQEELTLETEFPFIESKVISTGQRIAFTDPSTGSVQVYEVKQAKTNEPDHYQSVTAENICVSELTDCHIDDAEFYDTTVTETLETLLNGTGWAIGLVDVNPVSSVKTSRGSVWSAILSAKDNYNVYLDPRVELASNGAIARYIDVKATNGTYNGLRLSVDKNMLDPSVTYDDSELVTAMYGYGGTVTEGSGETQEETTFADVVWSATDEHPAKPAGQKYIEDPAATAAYGRNGRARFGFYQNTNIDDPELLLQKTWESLQASSKPAISIEGTVADLYRMGYADQPIKLHDIALVEVLPAGYKAQIQIIKLTVDLLDPSATSLTIGAYIPNIIYIQKENNYAATGSRGGGGNKSKESERSIYETLIEQNNRMIRLHAYELKDLDSKVKVNEASIKVESNRITAEVIDRRNSDQVLSSTITQTATQIRTEVANTAAGLQSSIDQTATAISLEVTRATGAESSLSGRIDVQADKIGLVITQKDGHDVVDAASIVAGINGQTGSYIKLQAKTIDINGIVNALTAYDVSVETITTTNTATFGGEVTIKEGATFDGSDATDITNLDADNATFSSLTLGSHEASWKSKTVVTGVTRGNTHRFVYSTDGSLQNLSFEWGTVVTAVDTATIYYLGR